ncbi:MAG: hypothetical protein M1832_000116 [Thelocarpon impressellum]|nr:MAG: hypothetical protein M1832_000116 [Thelocarpon impressellum]
MSCRAGQALRWSIGAYSKTRLLSFASRRGVFYRSASMTSNICHWDTLLTPKTAICRCINLTDPTFRGVYHGKHAHADDFEDVLNRAVDVGVEKFMVTGSSLKESRRAVELAEQHRACHYNIPIGHLTEAAGLCYATVGVHPCSSKDFDSDPSLLSSIEALASASATAGTAVAFGEIGLDYDRLFLSPKETQLRTFQAQLEVAVRVQLPLFLHSRAAAADFERLLGAKIAQLPRRGLVHSFTGTLEEMQRLLDLGLDIGVNGCSLKTSANLAVVQAIPLDRMQLETDGPWCEIRPSHASSTHLTHLPALKAVKKEKFVPGAMVKGRNEPSQLPRVAHVVAGVKGVGLGEVVDAAWANSVRMFGLGVA